MSRSFRFLSIAVGFKIRPVPRVELRTSGSGGASGYFVANKEHADKSSSFPYFFSAGLIAFLMEGVVFVLGQGILIAADNSSDLGVE